MKNLLPILLLSLIVSCTNEEDNNTVSIKQEETNINNEENLTRLKRIDSIQSINDSLLSNVKNKKLADSINYTEFVQFWTGFREAIMDKNEGAIIRNTSLPLETRGWHDSDPFFYFDTSEFITALNLNLELEGIYSIDGKSYLDKNLVFIEKSHSPPLDAVNKQNGNYARVFNMIFKKQNNSWKLQRLYTVDEFSNIIDSLIKKDTAITKIKLDSSSIIKNHDVIAKRNYQLPKPLDDNGITYKTILKRIKEDGWDKPLGGTAEWSEWLYKETFRPIGWSKDGKFAFLINGTGEVEYLKLVIVNSKTNKIICKIKEVDYILNDFWNYDYGKIEKVLTENKIIQQYDFQLDIESLPQIKLKDHPVEKLDLKVLKGSIGVLQNPFESNAVTIDYYFWHDGGRGEGGTEFDVNGINNLDETK